MTKIEVEQAGEDILSALRTGGISAGRKRLCSLARCFCTVN
jgi:hypothetical protein